MNAFITATLRPHYRVVSALDGRAGLKKALVLAPDLILADVMMPVLSGDAMVLELRARAEMAGVPIVMLTAKADDELRVRLLKEGIQQYLNKPFAVAELLAQRTPLPGYRQLAVLAPLAAGQQIGTIRLTLDDKPYAEYPLVAVEGVARANFIKRGWDGIKLWFK